LEERYILKCFVSSRLVDEKYIDQVIIFEWWQFPRGDRCMEF